MKPQLVPMDKMQPVKKDAPAEAIMTPSSIVLIALHVAAKASPGLFVWPLEMINVIIAVAAPNHVAQQTRWRVKATLRPWGPKFFTLISLWEFQRDLHARP